MNSTTGKNESGAPEARPPLLSIGLIVAVMLIIPAFLYSVAPDEPLKEGVVVFSNGKQRAYLAEPASYQQAGYTNYCVLEPSDQLVVIQKPSDRPDGSLLARFEGKTAVQFPFCPPQAQVIVKAHQVIQKESLLRTIRDRIERFFKG